MSADEILFRCSSLHALMSEGNNITEVQLAKIAELSTKDKRTEKQEAELGRLIYKRDNPELADTTKSHLVDVYVRNHYNRFDEINSKYLDKGNDVEEDSITVVSRITKTFFKKNERHLKNSFIMGTPDLFKGENVEIAKEIRDTKSSWNAFTFFRAKHKLLDSRYYWQGLGYMWLTGAKICHIDYCLNNTPYQLIESELRKESYNHLNQDTPAWIELQVISNHVYDRETFDKYIQQRGCFPNNSNAQAIVDGFVEIPLNERHFVFTFNRNEADIIRLTERIINARKWMNTNLYTPTVMLAEHDKELNTIIVT